MTSAIYFSLIYQENKWWRGMAPVVISDRLTWAIIFLVCYLTGSAISQECGGLIQAGSGVILSPHYPNGYPPSASCEWILQAREECRIRIRFKARDCRGEFLGFYEGARSIPTELIGHYCDEDPPAILDSSGRVMTVKFMSGDSEAAQQGFVLSYEAIDDETGSRVIWSELLLPFGESRINSIAADPTTLITQSVALNQNVSTRVFYNVPRGNWTALATRYAEGEMVWSAGDLKTLIQGTIGSSRTASTYFAWTSPAVYGIAVDWLTGNVYWTDAAYDWIMLSNSNGTQSTIIIDDRLDIPNGVVIHPSEGWLFWTDSGSNPKLERSNLAGGNRIELVTVDIVRPRGITIDYDTNMVYWVDADPSNNRLELCDLNGANRRQLFLTHSNLELCDLTIFENYVYVTGRASNALIIISKDSGQELLTLNLRGTPFGVLTYAPDVQSPGYSPCSSNPCSYLCVGSGPNGYTCLCGNGLLLSADGHTCKKEGVIDPPQLFVASQTKLCRYPVNFPDVTFQAAVNLNVSCFMSNLLHAVAMAVDLEDGVVFFSDIGTNGIGMATLRHGSPLQVLTAGTKSVQGIAVDWLTKHIYWTDNQRNTIEVSKYNGSYRTTLIKDNVRRPRSIAIDAEKK